jgi:hypothetical protein
MLAVTLLGGGTAALAATGGVPLVSSSKSTKASANSQYCPPSSQQPGKPKKPGPAKCGKPKTKCVSGKNKKGKKSAVTDSKKKKKSCAKKKGKNKKHKKNSKKKNSNKKHGSNKNK